MKCTVFVTHRFESDAYNFPTILEKTNGNGLERLLELPGQIHLFALSMKTRRPGQRPAWDLGGQLGRLFYMRVGAERAEQFAEALRLCERIECILDIHDLSEESLVFKLTVRVFGKGKRRLGPELEVRIPDDGKDSAVFLDRRTSASYVRY